MKNNMIAIKKTCAKYIFLFLGWLFALGTVLPAVAVGQFSQTDSAFPYDVQGQEYNADTEVPTTDIAKDMIKEDINSTNNSPNLLSRLTDLFRLSGTSYATGTSRATNYVKWILNILLGLVSFLSLVMVIFAFYLIFFSKGEDGVAKAKKILVGVGIALAIMWLSRFIASFFFQIYNTVT